MRRNMRNGIRWISEVELAGVVEGEKLRVGWKQLKKRLRHEDVMNGRGMNGFHHKQKNVNPEAW